MGSALTYSGVTLPKEEIGLASVFLYRLNGKQQGGGFFS